MRRARSLIAAKNAQQRRNSYEAPRLEVDDRVAVVPIFSQPAGSIRETGRDRLCGPHGMPLPLINPDPESGIPIVQSLVVVGTLLLARGRQRIRNLSDIRAR
jgi:hypothetical protein